MHVTAELVASVASLAERRFFNAMFSGGQVHMRDRLRVVVGDAMKPCRRWWAPRAIRGHPAGHPARL